MRCYFTDNNQIQVLVRDMTRPGNVSFENIEAIKPNEHMSVYLFDLVHLPHFQYEYTEEEFKKDCPEWVGKNWAFVKQMATGFTHVCLYSHKWFVYSRDNNTFRVTETPTLAREAIVMSPLLTHESRNEIKHLFDAVGFAGGLWSKINRASDLESNDVDSYKTLCFKLVELLQTEEAEADFWFEAFENLMSNCSDDNYRMEEDVCRWDDLKHLYSRQDDEYKKFEAHSWQVRDCFLG